MVFAVWAARRVVRRGEPRSGEGRARGVRAQPRRRARPRRRGRRGRRALGGLRRGRPSRPTSARSTSRSARARSTGSSSSPAAPRSRGHSRFTRHAALRRGLTWDVPRKAPSAARGVDHDDPPVPEVRASLRLEDRARRSLLARSP